MEIFELKKSCIDDFLDLVNDIKIMTKKKNPQIRDKTFGNFSRNILIEIINQNKQFQFSKIFILKENNEMIGYVEIDFLSTFNKIQFRCKKAIIKFPLLLFHDENLFVSFISQIVKYLDKLGIKSLLLFYSNLLPYNTVITKKLKFKNKVISDDEILKIYTN